MVWLVTTHRERVLKQTICKISMNRYSFDPVKNKFVQKLKIFRRDKPWSWNAEGETSTFPLTCTLYKPVLITKLYYFTNLLWPFLGRNKNTNFKYKKYSFVFNIWINFPMKSNSEGPHPILAFIKKQNQIK